MFKKISFKKINDNNYIFYNTYSSNIYKFKSCKLYVPFGLENYKGKIIFNFDIRDIYGINKDFYKLIIEIDNYFRNNVKEKIPELNDLEYVSFIKKVNVNYKNCLFRTQVIKSTECYRDSELISIYQIGKKTNVELLINISNLWIHNGKYGITLDLDKIKLLF